MVGVDPVLIIALRRMDARRLLVAVSEVNVPVVLGQFALD
jgi:hypothetical protein